MESVLFPAKYRKRSGKLLIRFLTLNGEEIVEVHGWERLPRKWTPATVLKKSLEDGTELVLIKKGREITSWFEA